MLTYWGAFLPMSGGAFIGLLVLLTLRVIYYNVMNYSANMAPQMAYFFSPILLLVIIVVSLPIEFLFRYWHAPTNRFQAMFIGMGYSTLLTWWAFPGHWQIFVLLNPIFVRWLIGLRDRTE